MKLISPTIYARAYLEAIDEYPRQTKAITEKFVAAIQHNRDWPRRNAILAAVEKQWRQTQKKPLVVAESARPLEATHKKHIEKSFLGSYDFEYRINPELVAGVRLTINDEYQKDGSLAHILKHLF